MNPDGKNTPGRTLKRGLWSGARITWTLSKIIFPITLIIVILQHTPVLPWVVQLVAPMMGLFGLRGEAAIPIVLGASLNLYAGIAGILTLQLSVKEVFIIALMMSFAHNMFVETAVALKVGVKLWIVLLVRFGVGMAAAVCINLFWRGGSEMAIYGLVPPAAVAPAGWLAVVWLAFNKATLGVAQLVAIVVPLMVLTQLLKDYDMLGKLSRQMSPVMAFLGIKPNASLTLLAGFLIGLAYGAGLMIQAVKEDGVSRRDVTLTFIFLMCCHAVVEDTLLFVPLGIPILPLFMFRLVMAVVLTVTISRLWSAKQRPADLRESLDRIEPPEPAA